jgi:hypothetical protein
MQMHRARLRLRPLFAAPQEALQQLFTSHMNCPEDGQAAIFWLEHHLSRSQDLAAVGHSLFLTILRAHSAQSNKFIASQVRSSLLNLKRLEKGENLTNRCDVKTYGRMV